MSSDIRILVVDDEPGICDLLAQELAAHGYRVDTAGDGEAALEKIRASTVHLVISDVKMPRMDGIQLLAGIKRIDPDIEVVLTTGYGTIETAVAAMKQGAYDFVQKPFPIEALLRTVEKALESRELKSRIALYESSRAVFASVRLDDLLPQIVTLAVRLLRADDASVLLREKDRLRLAASTGLKDEERRLVHLALGERVAGRVAAQGSPVILNGPLEKNPAFPGTPSLRPIASSIVFPLVLDGENLGVLCINRTTSPGEFTTRDVRTATVFASQIAQAVRNAQLVGRLEEKIREVDAARRRLEEAQDQLVRSEKMATIGQLAAGVAHELNNPLTSVLGFAQLLLRDTGLDARQRTSLQHIETQGKRCARIIQSLLKFSRQNGTAHQVIEVGPLLQETLELIRYELDRNGIELREEIGSTIPPVRGDGCQLQQVFLNLVTNAIHAMEGRPQRILAVRVRPDPGRVAVDFADTGSGIAAEHRARLFEPFFTTQPPGKGTGLGLFIAGEILRQHGGAIRVESREGAGATFTVELPA
jgi:two-component system, NtrC family, sensor kinase